MSDASEPLRGWRFYIADMIEFGENVLSFTDGMDRDAFIGDARTYHAVLRNLELIGEAATHIPAGIREAHPDIPWHAIIGARNRMAHAYRHIDDDVIWTMIEDAVPELLPALRQLLETVEREGE